MSLEALRSTTRDILRMTEEILRAGAAPIDLPRLADLRKNAALAYTSFFAQQEAALLRPLRESGDPALVAIASCLVERDLEGRRMGLVHYQRWPLTRIAEDPSGYQADVRRYFRWLEGRVLYAEQTAYPALARLISSSKRSTC
jgi:hypothetical protein